MIHSQLGFADGVSIVMKQVEDVMVNLMKIPKSNIFYLVGKARTPSPYIRQKEILSIEFIKLNKISAVATALKLVRLIWPKCSFSGLWSMLIIFVL